MEIIEAPEMYRGNDQNTIFLAGGITDCPDWQKEIAELFNEEDIVLFNPRRANFPIHDPTAAEKQITWEFKHLRKAKKILFWFPKETMCPIVLYELGAHCMTNKPIYVGVHPKYERKQDVEIQTKLVRPEIEVVYSIEDLVNQVKGELK